MIRSMTGFGEAEADSRAGRMRIEVKTVNHRYFNAAVKTPYGFDRFEAAITEALKRHVQRGHATVYLSRAREEGVSPAAIEVDVERARAYLRALEALRTELQVPGVVDLAMLARYGEVFRAPEPERVVEVDAEVVVGLAESAARAVRTMREAEGARLEADLRARLAAIGKELTAAEARAPQRVVEHRDKLRAAVQELVGQVDVDDERLAREVAYLADRWDVNEEVVRFRSHVELFREALSGDGSEPVGKRLGFLAQEMHREANTIGSKANDAELARVSVALKEEVERIREQVENVE